MGGVRRSWWETPAGVLGVLVLGLVGMVVAGAIMGAPPEPASADPSLRFRLGLTLGLSSVLVAPAVAATLAYGILRHRRRAKRSAAGSYVPLTVTAGIAGWPREGGHFPRYTARLLGKLTITRRGLTWRPFAPWRKPRAVEVPWSDIRRVQLESGGGWVVEADGWSRLYLAPSEAEYVAAAVEDCGMAWNRHPWTRRAGNEVLWPDGVPAERGVDTSGVDSR